MRTLHPIVSALLLTFLATCGPERFSDPPAGPLTAAPRQELSCRAWRPLDSGNNMASFRGLSAVDDDVVWVSGTGGTWGLSTDGGATWNRVATESLPPAYGGEAGFAASGSGLTVLAGGHAWFGSGGPHPRIFHSSDHGLTWQAEDGRLARLSEAPAPGAEGP
ncbi:MAG: exo-alpha-sialidase [bacterium]|nr:exo-alpha-sialidase [bacterium]